MSKLETQVSGATLKALEKRVERLVALIEVVTQASPEKRIRETGSQLIDRLGEWIDDIRGLNEVGDEDVREVMKSFHIRLHLAEEKTKSWQIPKQARKQVVAAAARRRAKLGASAAA